MILIHGTFHGHVHKYNLILPYHTSSSIVTRTSDTLPHLEIPTDFAHEMLKSQNVHGIFRVCNVYFFTIQVMME